MLSIKFFLIILQLLMFSFEIDFKVIKVIKLIKIQNSNDFIHLRIIHKSSEKEDSFEIFESLSY